MAAPIAVCLGTWYALSPNSVLNRRQFEADCRAAGVSLRSNYRIVSRSDEGWLSVDSSEGVIWKAQTDSRAQIRDVKLFKPDVPDNWDDYREVREGFGDLEAGVRNPKNLQGKITSEKDREFRIYVVDEGSNHFVLISNMKSF